MSNRGDLFGSAVPKTVVGLAVWVLMFALGASLSGLIFFAIYQNRVNSLEDRVIKVEQTIDKQVQTRIDELRKELEDSKEQGSSNLKVSSAGLDEFVKSVSGSVARIQGLDAARKPTQGSGFVVRSNSTESWIITNNHLVAGAMIQNLPVRVRLGGTELDSEVYATDAGRDLALVIFKKGNVRSLRFIRDEAAVSDQVWALGMKATGFEAGGATGKLTEVSGSGLLTNAAIPQPFTGGPLLDQDANVVGVITIPKPDQAVGSSSRAVPIKLTCVAVLRCGGPINPTPSPTSKASTPRPTATPAPSDSEVPAEPAITPTSPEGEPAPG